MADGRRAYRVAYDGRRYAGFQRQPHARTVEGTLLGALADLGVVDRGSGPTHATPDGYAAAGRTDAGVSAVAQTVAFDAPNWLRPRAFNSRLPDSIRVWAAADVPNDFHATHRAVERTYRYYLDAPRDGDGGDHHNVNGGDHRNVVEGDHRNVVEGDHRNVEETEVVDPERLRAALSRLAGTHDFRNLTTDERGTVRTIDASATRKGRFLVIEVTADGFPRALVRRLVAVARLVATGRADLPFLDRVLDPDPLPGHLGVGPAEPEPLVLWDVAYEGVRFELDEQAAEAARAAFRERRREALRTAAVSGAIRSRIGDVMADRGGE
ncbi:tRNA pseudouridine(38-40) synthase TruA [Halorubrum vacuolatum]|uniref:tRNA pseudouridine(38-40) synthase TruA n=1 Tax=Halorubrum vacuolatum TaxID=63740 RepID=UPI000B77F849|nr:tRNA pseudouridine(38-40) synthase TruA [Halorubrum vacuolatum]